jgi:hypothetical protein
MHQHYRLRLDDLYQPKGLKDDRDTRSVDLSNSFMADTRLSVLAVLHLSEAQLENEDLTNTILANKRHPCHSDLRFDILDHVLGVI